MHILHVVKLTKCQVKLIGILLLIVYDVAEGEVWWPVITLVLGGCEECTCVERVWTLRKV
jgi:hypothetical protein